LLLFDDPVVVPESDWNPETNLPTLEDRRDITQEFRSGTLVDFPVDLRLIQHIDSHPESLYSLTPRQFEELTAELLRNFGYQATLTSKGRDGGIDVFAERETAVGTELVIVQCKKNSEDNKVGAPVIKQLYGDVAARKATRGLLVTTSRFSSVALDFIRQTRYRLEGADIDKLRDWIARVRRL
jgi:restriction system protein